MIGKILGNRYEILNKIGEGGMAFVYTGKCTLLNRIVAIKILKPEFARDEEFLEKFKNEAQAAARVNNPNIVNVYDVGQEEDYSYIVMEYVDGENLKDMIRSKGKLAEDDALNIAEQIARALQVAHSKGIIHRDIKSHNIMLTNNNIVKVGDFGIAKAVSSATITAVGSIMGSVHYFSPEQARGGYVDERSDIYSLGIVLFEMLTGRVPFDGDSPVNIALKQIQDAIKFAPDEDIREDIKAFVGKLAAKSPDRRYKNIDEVIDKIEVLRGKKSQTNITNSEIGKYTPVEETIHRDDKFSSSLTVVDNTVGDNKKIKSAGGWKITVLAIVLALLLSTVGGFAFVFFGGFDGIFSIFSDEKIELVDFRGLTLEEAKENATVLGVEVIQDGTEINNNYPNGTIASQSPEKGVKVDKGSLVKVTLSVEAIEEFEVPDFTGYKLEDARNEIKALGLNEVVKLEVSDLEVGTVMLQAPVGGTVVRKGELIQLVVSKKSEEEEAEKNTMVPQVEGKTLDEARSILSQFTLTESYREDRTKDNGTILSQSPLAGTMIEEGGAVSIVINRIEKKPIVSYPFLVMLPTDKDELRVRITDKSNGDVFYDQTINPKYEVDNILKVTMTGEEGEKRVYSVYIDGKHWADHEVTFGT